MIKFGNTDNFYLLIFIPILSLFLLLFLKWRKKNLLKFSSKNLQENTLKNKSVFREKLKYLFQFLGILFLIIGLTNPQIGTNLEEVKREGIEIVIAIDLSNSMLCEDIKPNRLLRSKQAINKLIDQLEGDRIGIVIFAGESYTQLPITSDYSAAKMFLSTINTKSINTQGTNIAKAIRQSVKSFNFENEYNKSIIIITDGEDHEEGAITESNKAAEKGVFIHTLAIGSENGGPIPLSKGRGYKKDREGNTIVTKPNFVFLSELAHAGNGININANNSDLGLTTLFNEISKIEKKEISSLIFTDYTHRFQLFLFISLFFFMLNLIISEKQNLSLKKWFL